MHSLPPHPISQPPQRLAMPKQPGLRHPRQLARRPLIRLRNRHAGPLSVNVLRNLRKRLGAAPQRCIDQAAQLAPAEDVVGPLGLHPLKRNAPDREKRLDML